jgi:hypothetical protein
MTIPALIGTTIDDGSYSPNDLLVLVGQKILGLTTFERRVLIATEGSHLVAIQKRYCVLIATIQIVVELDELLEFLLGVYLSNLYHFFGISKIKQRPFFISSFAVQR